MQTKVLPVVAAMLAAMPGAAGCTSGVRLGAPPASPIDANPPGFSGPVRADAFSRNSMQLAPEDLAAMRAAAEDGSFDLLALSGGGAGGAFGAGVLVGLTRIGQRPTFELVTGVSTGSLIAPFAFLGSDWDDELTGAYRGEATANLLRARGLGVLFDVGVFDGAPLRELVSHFVTDELVAAVAAEAAKGRMLLVATTNLDREETIIWNMGAISRQGGPRARELFREVLVASASVPGVFPPVMIDVEKDGVIYQEMHVDGGASLPFFIAPEIAFITGYSPASLDGGNVYVIINGQVASTPRTTSINTLDIAARSFTAVLNHMTRQALVQTRDYAASAGMNFRFTMMPADIAFGGSLAFEPDKMNAIFDYGVRCASAEAAWLTPEDAVAYAEAASNQVIEVKPPEEANCPLLARPR